MSVVTDDVLTKVARVIGGDDAVKVVLALKDLKEATDDQLLSKTEMKLNDIRKILFKLYNYSIVQCDRSRDKDTGGLSSVGGFNPIRLKASSITRRRGYERF